MLSQTSLPMFTFVWRTVLRNLITLAHHMVIVLGVLIFFGYWQVMNLPLALLGLLFLVVNAAWISLLASICSARFRDVPQIVISVMQFALFMTPVFWRPEGKLVGHAVLEANPFYHMLQAVRGPLMGKPVELDSYLFLGVMAVLGWAFAFTVFSRTRRRIVHYL
jgi:ABC-type polysaccharide/polyol phosphate export permease